MNGRLLLRWATVAAFALIVIAATRAQLRRPPPPSKFIEAGGLLIRRDRIECVDPTVEGSTEVYLIGRDEPFRVDDDHWASHAAKGGFR